MAEDHDYVAMLKRAYEAFNRGDFEAAVEFAHPEIEFGRFGGFSSIKGREALLKWMAPDALKDQRAEPHEFKVNGDRVLVPLTVHARGAETGLETTVNGYQVWTFENGRAIRSQVLLDRNEALAAAGLPADS